MSQMSDMIVQELGLQGAETLSTLVSDTNHESEELLDHERVKKSISPCALDRAYWPQTELTCNSEPRNAADRCQDRQCETGPN